MSIRAWEDRTVAASDRTTIESVEELADSLANARIAIRDVERAIRRALKKVEQGGDIAEGIAAVQPAMSRARLNDALREVERCRHRTRLEVFRLALDSGMSIAELGRVWGFSRQLAARLAKEARSSRKPAPSRAKR